MAKNQYYGALDGLRAICIILTLMVHTAGNPGINGTVGVDIFFALSGYLITTLLLREREATGDICLCCFYLRRLFRIAPLYILTILLYLPGVLLSYRVTGNVKGISDFQGALPWLLTFNSEWRSEIGNNLFGHAWTLGIEEKFYLVWPLIFGIMAVVRKPGIMLPALAAPFFLLAGPEMARGYIGILFGVIAALAIQNDVRGTSFIRRVPTALWFGAMLAGYAIATVAENPYLNMLVSLPAALFIAALVNKDRDVFKTALSSPILVHLGKLTYAIYLIHRLVGNTFEQVLPRLGWQPGFFLSFLMVYLACIPSAWVLHITIEQPLIRLGKIFARRTLQTAELPSRE